MGRKIRMSCCWTILFGCLGSAVPASGADRPADEILKALDAVKLPAIDRARVSDPSYRQQLQREMEEVSRKRDSLILELYRTDLNHDKLPFLMAERWDRIPLDGPARTVRDTEVKSVLEHATNPQLRTEATFARSLGRVFDSRSTGHPDVAAVDEFIKVAPKDPRGVQLLFICTRLTADAEARSAIEDRITKDFPDSKHASSILGMRRKTRAIGKPFELEFTEALTGAPISMKNLKGKVVVLDFWATWCGPCVEDMPRLKKLYAKYHDRGVEFVGISLDQPKEEGGLDRLKKFVKDNKMPWPQYYQGNGWESRVFAVVGYRCDSRDVRHRPGRNPLLDNRAQRPRVHHSRGAEEVRGIPNQERVRRPGDRILSD